MLMVMMSFFIIFFSFDANQRKNALEEIAMSINETGFKVKAEGDESASSVGGQAGEGVGGMGVRGKKEVTFPKLGLPETEDAIASLRPQDLAAAIATSMGAFGVVVHAEPNKENLILNLPPNIFDARKFTLDKERQKILENVLLKLKPAMGRVTVSFIGHTDSKPVSLPNSDYSDNFTLSSLRAWHGLRTAVAMGLPPKGMTILGAADQIFESRSLSIKLTMIDTESK
jgi:outer membrane protein OmpA-like peptidoglycan-associated protein